MRVEGYSKASSTCSPNSEVVLRSRLEGAQDINDEVVDDLGMEGAGLLQLSLPPLRGEATLLNSYSHEVSIVTRLRSWVRLNEWRSNLGGKSIRKEQFP